MASPLHAVLICIFNVMEEYVWRNDHESDRWVGDLHDIERLLNLFYDKAEHLKGIDQSPYFEHTPTEVIISSVIQHKDGSRDEVTCLPDELMKYIDPRDCDSIRIRTVRLGPDNSMELLLSKYLGVKLSLSSTDGAWAKATFQDLKNEISKSVPRWGPFTSTTVWFCFFVISAIPTLLLGLIHSTGIDFIVFVCFSMLFLLGTMITSRYFPRLDIAPEGHGTSSSKGLGLFGGLLTVVVVPTVLAVIWHQFGL